MINLTNGCKLKTEKITIRSKSNTKIESSKVIELTYVLKNITFDNFVKEIKFINKPESLNFEKSAVLIQDHIKDFNILANKADELIEKTRNGKKFEEIHYDKIKNNFLLIMIAIDISVVTIVIAGFILYKRFYNVNTWMKLTDRLGQLDLPPTKLFVQATPRRNSLASIEMREN